MKFRVKSAEQKERTHGASPWDQHDCYQASGSNDCGVLSLLMRLLRAHSQPPELPKEEAKKEDIIRRIGSRMRSRIAAESILGGAYPADNLIPEWLKGF